MAAPVPLVRTFVRAGAPLSAADPVGFGGKQCVDCRLQQFAHQIRRVVVTASKSSNHTLLVTDPVTGLHHPEKHYC